MWRNFRRSSSPTTPSNATGSDMSTPHIASQLTRLALPLVPTHGFTAHTLMVASSSSAQPLSLRTIDALYPSPPADIPSPDSFSLRGLAIGNGGRRSLSRPELIALARGQGIVPGSPQEAREKTGPARALLKEWLEQGRRDMVQAMKQSGLSGRDAIQKGIRTRLTYNEPVLDKLPQALALLSAPTTTPLSSPTSVIPSPIPHLAHVASIAQDLAKASGSQAQGTAWYSLRARLGLIYSLSELHLLSRPDPNGPSSSPSSSFDRQERISDAIRYSETLWEQTNRVGQRVQGVEDFSEWVTKSWIGIGRSFGV